MGVVARLVVEDAAMGYLSATFVAREQRNDWASIRLGVHFWLKKGQVHKSLA